MRAAFDYKYLEGLISEFVDTMPRILEKSPVTADFSDRMGRLVELSEMPFTLAVIGQMRVGKSTLINAMIGKDLAPVGVTETTATINYFKYGNGDVHGRFRVFYKNRPEKWYNLSDITKWLGDSGLAKNTRYIEFFDEADFLKEIYLVDTPGTRSVIGGHTSAINNFLAEKLERETLQCGGKADAILYVLGPIAREADRNLLQEFEQTTRSLGSSPINAIAVLHKWESMEEEDPYAAAIAKAKRIKGQLSNFVSEVVPVSGPFARAAAELTPQFWSELVHLFFSLDKRQRNRYVESGMESRFKRKFETGARLLEASHLPWACFQTLCKMYGRNPGIDPERLQQLTEEASGLRQLMKIVHERFIERTQLLKSFALLHKALNVSEKARFRLGNAEREVQTDIEKGKVAEILIDQMVGRGFANLKPALDFVQSTSLKMKGLCNDNDQLRKTVEDLSRGIQDHFCDLNNDIDAIRIVDDQVYSFGAEELNEIRTILGCYGHSIEDRMNFYSGKPNKVLEYIEGRIEFWSGKEAAAAGFSQKVYRQVVNRLEQIADVIEGPFDVSQNRH